MILEKEFLLGGGSKRSRSKELENELFEQKPETESPPSLKKEGDSPPMITSINADPTRESLIESSVGSIRADESAYYDSDKYK